MTNYQNLDVWKKSIQLVKDVYETVKSYPNEERYALVQQTKRAVISIPSNIAEGIGRNYKKDTIQCLHIARGSLYELETLMCIAMTLKFLDELIQQKMIIQIQECIRLLNGLIAYFEKAEHLK
jgi:four helix bundle protein